MTGTSKTLTKPRTDSDWFNILAESAWFAVFVYKWDVDLKKERLIYVNPACARLTGFEVSELIQMTPADLLHPEHRALFPRLGEGFSDLPADSSPLEMKINRKDGDERWVAFSAGETQYEGNRARIGIAVDITPRRKALEALDRSLEFENVLAEISHSFLQLEANDLEYGVVEALGCICEVANLDRGSLLEMAPDGSSTSAVHGHSNTDSSGTPDTLENFPLDQIEWLMQQLRRGDPVHISNLDELPEAAAELRELLESRGASSMFCVPLFFGAKMQGIASFSEVGIHEPWGAERLRLMQVGAEILGSAIHRLRAEQELHASREWLELAQRAGNSGAWEWHTADDRMVFSASTAGVFGVDPNFLPTTGEQLLRMIPKSDQKRISDTFRRIFTTDEPYFIEHRIRIPGHGTVWAMVRGQVQRDANGNVIRVVGVSAVITELKRAEQALRREKELAQVTLASISDGVIRTDGRGRIDYLNPAAERLIGVTLKQVFQKPVSEVYSVTEAESGTTQPNIVDQCLATRQIIEPTKTSILVRQDGSEFVVRESAAPIVAQDGALVGAVLVFKDVTQVRGLQRRMTHLATHDPLTGLINRREFELRLSQAITVAGDSENRFTLCYLDLDEFKVVNDSCGHSAGDELLRQLTSVLSAVISAGDTLARLGGDEFGILYSDCTLDEAQRQARTLLDAIRQYRFQWKNRVFEVGASIGIVPVAGTGGSLSELLSAADSACYIAKDRGRNQIHVSEPGHAEITMRRHEMRWVERINLAIEEDRLSLFIQPIRPLQQTSNPEYYEILLRLIDVDGEIVLPSQFIPAAERYRMMPVIDRWVVRASLQSIGQLGDTPIGSASTFAINLSGQSLGNPELTKLIIDGLDHDQIDPSKILFEITETAAISNLSAARDFIRALRDRGCRFILDDFGSGLSSFRYLKSLKVDFLKIDGELVRNIAQDPIQREMVVAIHRIGRSMGIRTIGEWVENSAVENILREIGVDYAQGYGIEPPSPFAVENRHCRIASNRPLAHRS